MAQGLTKAAGTNARTELSRHLTLGCAVGCTKVSNGMHCKQYISHCIRVKSVLSPIVQ